MQMLPPSILGSLLAEVRMTMRCGGSDPTNLHLPFGWSYRRFYSLHLLIKRK